MVCGFYQIFDYVKTILWLLTIAFVASGGGVAKRGGEAAGYSCRQGRSRRQGARQVSRGLAISEMRQVHTFTRTVQYYIVADPDPPLRRSDHWKNFINNLKKNLLANATFFSSCLPMC